MAEAGQGIDTWDLGEILAALREIAREDAGRTEHAAAAAEDEVIRCLLPALTPGERQ